MFRRPEAAQPSPAAPKTRGQSSQLHNHSFLTPSTCFCSLLFACVDIWLLLIPGCLTQAFFNLWSVCVTQRPSDTSTSTSPTELWITTGQPWNSVTSCNTYILVACVSTRNPMHLFLQYYAPLTQTFIIVRDHYNWTLFFKIQFHFDSWGHCFEMFLFLAWWNVTIYLRAVSQNWEKLLNLTVCEMFQIIAVIWTFSNKKLPRVSFICQWPVRLAASNVLYWTKSMSKSVLY